MRVLIELSGGEGVALTLESVKFLEFRKLINGVKKVENVELNFIEME